MVKGKNRKSKKGLAIVLLILFMVAGAGVCYCYLPQAHAAVESEEPVLEEGQEYTYAKITSLLGNEMEYIIVEAHTIDFADSDEKSNRRKENGFGQNPGGGKRGQTTQNEEMSSAGEMPDMRNMPMAGEMPDMGNTPSVSEMPDMGNMPTAGKMPAKDKGEGTNRSGIQKSSTGDNTANTQNATIMTYTETDVTGQMQIPVGTEVETKLGTITTFSRLSSGDIIKMLLQKDDTGKKALMKIWIIE